MKSDFKGTCEPNAVIRLIEQYYAESEAIINKRGSRGMLPSPEDMKQLTVLAKAIERLEAVAGPGEVKETLIVVRPRKDV